MPSGAFQHIKLLKIFRGAPPPNPLARGAAPGPHWGLCPQTPAAGRSVPLGGTSLNRFSLRPPPLSQNPGYAPAHVCVSVGSGSQRGVSLDSNPRRVASQLAAHIIFLTTLAVRPRYCL